jgi:hypothetical protein
MTMLTPISTLRGQRRRRAGRSRTGRPAVRLGETGGTGDGLTASASGPFGRP